MCRLLEQGHASFVETVPFTVIAAFTVLQFIGLAAVYVVSSWTGVSSQHACCCHLHSVCMASDVTHSESASALFTTFAVNLDCKYKTP